MTSFQEIRDPVHGFIGLTEEELRIVNTRVFQRLRGVRQLAMASLVYPGALHTRFDHSLGVAHVAGLLANRLVSDQGGHRRIRMAALLHDIGHGPFSHVSEYILDQYSPAVSSKIREKIHEQLTARIIETDTELDHCIGRNTCRDIVDILKGGHVESVERGIVSGPLDADKQDYLLRDSYFCGVKYGVFDLPRLIDCLRVEPAGTEYLLTATYGGVPAIEQFVMAKYYMTVQVYRHKGRLISDSMIVRALQLGIDRDNLPWLRDLYTYDGSDRFIENFLSWDDARLSTALLHPLGGSGGLATDLFRKLAQRQLFKRVFVRALRDFGDPTFRVEFPNIIKDTKYRSSLEQEIAACLSDHAGSEVPSDYVILHQYGLKSVREQSRNDEGSIVIHDAAGPRKFEDASTLFRSIDEKQNDQFVEVYAPFPFHNKTDQRRLAPRLSDEIAALLEKSFLSQVNTPKYPSV